MRSFGSLLVAVIYFAVAESARGEESVSAQRGDNLYERFCLDCRDGPLAEELRVAPADLTTIAARRRGVFPDTEIREIIDGRRRVRAHGPLNMPLWGREFGLSVASPGGPHEAETRDKINALLDYLKSIHKK